MDTYEPVSGEDCYTKPKGDPEAWWVSCKVVQRYGSFLWLDYGNGTPVTESRSRTTFRSRESYHKLQKSLGYE